MKKYKKILVGLDFSDADDSLLAYVKFLNKRFRPEEIHFLNVQEKLDISPEILAQFPQLSSDIKKNFETKLEDKVADFNVYGAKLVFDVLGGSVVDSTVSYGKDNDVDLLVLGRKKDLKNTKFNPERLAREFVTDTLLVPVGAAPEINAVLMMLDYSSFCKDALLDLIDSAAGRDFKIITSHLFEVPIGFEKTGKSFSEFAEIMKANAQAEYEKFMKGVDTKGVEITSSFDLSNDRHFSDVVLEVAEREKVNAIVVAARGRTKAASFFLGSNTEQLVDDDSSIPLLITRDKKHTFGLFDAIAKLM